MLFGNQFGAGYLTIGNDAAADLSILGKPPPGPVVPIPRIDIGGTVTIGSDFNGKLTIADHIDAHFTTDIQIGDDHQNGQSTGEMIVDLSRVNTHGNAISIADASPGELSILNSYVDMGNGDLTVGNNDTGELVVSASDLISGVVFVGSEGIGTATVDNGSRWAVGNGLIIGTSEAGTVHVSGQSDLSSVNGTWLGDTATGILTVNNASYHTGAIAMGQAGRGEVTISASTASTQPVVGGGLGEFIVAHYSGSDGIVTVDVGSDVTTGRTVRNDREITSVLGPS